MQSEWPKGGPIRSENEGFYEKLWKDFVSLQYGDAKSMPQEIERLRDEVECLKRQLENKSKEIGASEHRGNTVDYIYDKLANYSRQLGDAGNALRQIETIVDKALGRNDTI